MDTPPYASLGFLGKPYKEFLEAQRNYEELREQHFGEVKRKVMHWLCRKYS